jgi:hypothetical protein
VRLRSRFAATVAAARDMTAKYDAVNLFRLELVGAKTQLRLLLGAIIGCRLQGVDVLPNTRPSPKKISPTCVPA